MIHNMHIRKYLGILAGFGLCGICMTTAMAQDNAPANPSTPTAENPLAGKKYNSFAAMLKDSMAANQAAAKAAEKDKKDAAPSKGTISEDAKPYVDAIQAYYDSAKTYSASFEQDYESVDGIKKQSKGTVWFKKPGKMRWDYETPEQRFLISDGKSFWSWEPVYRQYCKQDLAASQLPTALTFLAGGGRIEDDFSVSVNKISGNQITLDLKPVVSSMAYDRIKFEILMPSAKVYRATIYDAMGNVNKITFKSPEINAALDDSSFTFEPPKDAKHICE